MRPTPSFFLGFIVHIVHRIQRSLPYPHHFIHLQILWHRVGDEHHRRFALELVDGGGEVFSGSGTEAATEYKIPIYSFTRFSLNALPITVTELKLIAIAAIIGESSKPINGYSNPAAIGTPSTL